MRLQLNRLEQLAPLTDEEVAERVVSGDSGAFELLMRRHNQRLFRTARSVLRTRRTRSRKPTSGSTTGSPGFRNALRSSYG